MKNKEIELNINDLLDIFNYAKQGHNGEEVLEYLKNVYNSNSKEFAQAISKYQEYLSDDYKELLYDLAVDVERSKKVSNNRLSRDLILIDEFGEETAVYYDFYYYDRIFSTVERDIRSCFHDNFFSEEEKAKLTSFSKKYEELFSTPEKHRHMLRWRNALRELAPARETINKYIESGITSMAKYKAKNPDANIEKAINILEAANDPLYNEVKAYLKGQKTKRYAIILSIAKKMVLQIKEGVQLEDGTTRKFDFLDYYGMTKLEFEDFLEAIKNNIPFNEFIIIKNFAGNNCSKKPIYLNDICKTVQIFNPEYDKHGNIVEGTGRLVENFEKENIVKYIRKNNLPYTEVVYKALFNRWRNGNIEMPTKFNNDVISDQGKKY